MWSAAQRPMSGTKRFKSGVTSATTNERNETIQVRRDKRNGPDLRMARAALSGVSQDGGDVDPKEGLSMRTNIQRSNGARKKNNDGARAPY